jgi:hypothetical protein
MITADSPLLTSPFDNVIQSIIDRNLEIINGKIQTEPKRWGVNYIECKIDNLFVINGMDNIDAQQLIYDGIIVNLEKRKFKVKIVIDTNETILYVKWQSGNSLDDVAGHLSKTIIDQDDVEDWLQSSS